MATSYLTSDTLIESVERRAHVPQSQVTFQPEDYLALANEEIQMGLLPSIMQFHEEFFVVTAEIPLVDGQSSYDIPDRAIGMKLRTVHLKDSNGSMKEMARIHQEDEAWYQNNSSPNSPRFFYVENNSIVLTPNVQSTSGSTLIMRYFQRPNQLVIKDRIAIITQIDTSGNSVKVDVIPSVFKLSTPLDMLETKGGHRCRAIDVLPVTIDTTSKIITFESLPPTLVVGDAIALAGECYIPQIPDELHPVLSQRVVCRCLEAQGDATMLQLANQKLAEMELKMGNLIDNRSEGNPQKVNNLRGALRQGKIRRRRNLW